MIDLSIQQLVRGRKKALQNAIELADDAEVLINCGKWARGFFLCQIAVEELGKYALFVSSSISAVHGSLNRKKFLKRFKSHKEKTKLLLLIENMHNVMHSKEGTLSLTDKDKGYIHMQETLKMSSLYCDIVENEFTLPSEVISQNAAELSLRLLKQRVQVINSFETEVAVPFAVETKTRDQIQQGYEKLGIAELINKEVFVGE